MTNANTPEPPYYAVIFSNRLFSEDAAYHETAAQMEELAATMPGYIGIESVRGEDGFGITVSYWASEEAIAKWKRQTEHMVAQRSGRDDWYKNYFVRVAKVERAYAFSK